MAASPRKRSLTALGGTFAWHDLSSKRTLSFPGLQQTLRADYSARTEAFFAEAAYGFTPSGARLEPLPISPFQRCKRPIF